MNWYINVGTEKSIGPLDTTTVIEWILQGKIKSTANVCEVGQDTWQEISECPQFKKNVFPVFKESSRR